jgi:flagellar motor switch protein FliN/FliY
MGSSATALSTLLNRKIRITTRIVRVIGMDELARDYPLPFVAVEIAYTEGMKGKSVLNIRTDDVKIMTDIMMGGAERSSQVSSPNYT